MTRMEGCDRAHAFNLVDVPARLDEALAEKRHTGSIAEQEQAFRLDQRDLPPGDLGAGLPIRTGHLGAGGMEIAERRAVRALRGNADRREHPAGELPCL